jgi:hypothetical protein
MLRLGESGGVLVVESESESDGAKMRLRGSGKESVDVGRGFCAVGAGSAGRGVLLVRRWAGRLSRLRWLLGWLKLK